MANEMVIKGRTQRDNARKAQAAGMRAREYSTKPFLALNGQPPTQADVLDLVVDLQHHLRLEQGLDSNECFDVMTLAQQIFVTEVDAEVFGPTLPYPPNDQGPSQPHLPVLPEHLTVEDVARICHEANRAYCAALGDTSQPSWKEAPDWQRASAIAGVQAILDGTCTTPVEQHEAWMAQKVAEGWVYGPEKDPEAKTHPCLVPYFELPLAQRTKDRLFQHIVLGCCQVLEYCGAR